MLGDAKVIRLLGSCGLLCMLSCSEVPAEPESGRAATSLAVGHVMQGSTADAVYSGYVHYPERSSFNPAAFDDIGVLKAPSQQEVSSYSAGAFQRTEGPRGIYSLNTSCGSSGASPSPEVLLNFKPYGPTLDDHNAKVREYFLAAGIPASQIGAIQGSTEVSETEDHVTRLASYTTVVRRAINGVSILNSAAFASLADSGRSIKEWVYWPAVPRSVVDQAAAWAAGLTPAALASYRTKLPANVDWSQGPGEVVVRHQSAIWTGAPYARASFDVPTAAGARHFDVDGSEFRMPEDT